MHGLAGLQRILRSPEIDARLRQTPGRWSVACGLALQAIDQAAVPLNLVPAKEAGLLTKLPFLRRKMPTSAWGLDLGATGLKAVRLTLDPQQTAVTLDAVERLDFPGQFAQLADEVERRRLQVETLRQFAQRHSLADERIGVSVSGRQVLGRFVELPSDRVQAVGRPHAPRSERAVPGGLAGTGLGIPRLAAARRRPVGVGFPSRRHAGRQAASCRGVIESVPGCGAARRRIAERLLWPCITLRCTSSSADRKATGTSSPVVALLDLGAQSANLVLSAPDLVWFRSLAVAGDLFTNTLLRPLKLTREQAEQLKREPARARRVYRLYELWDPILTNLADEVERSLAACRRQFPGLEVQQMFGLGGGFQLHGVLRHLTS